MNKPTAAELNAIDMRKVSDLVLTQSADKKYIGMNAGQEHYRLLYWFGMQFERIVELGTYRGHSALSMAVGQLENGLGDVYSFDIENHRDVVVAPPSLVFGILFDAHKEVNANTKMVFLDTYHDGTYERVVINYLRDIAWKGVLVMDDIHLNDEMKAVWSEITERKEDWTDIGHWSGTGIVFFE